MNERDKRRSVDLRNPPPPPGMWETSPPCEPEKPAEETIREEQAKAEEQNTVERPSLVAYGLLILLGILAVLGIGWLLVHAVGMAVTAVSSGLKWVGAKIWGGIVFLTPYGRAAAADPMFRYCLHWCSGCVVLIAIISAFVCVAAIADLLPSLLGTTAICFSVWYCGYGLAFALVKLPFFFPYLAPVLMVVCCAVLAYLLIGIEYMMLD